MACLPIELLDVVIDILKHDTAALKTLSLVHSALTHPAHKHLFNHINISGEIDDIDNNNSILVTLSNPAHAHLLEYIHKLTLVNDTRRSFCRPNSTTQFYCPNPLIPIFIDAIAPHLYSLSLKGIAPGWDDSSNIPLKDVIIRMLALPTLTHFDLDSVNRFPIDLLGIAVGLKHLRFATPYPNHPGPNLPPLDDENVGDPICLDSLEIDLWSGEIPPTSFMKWIIENSRLSIAKLRSLSINGSYTKQVARTFWKLVEACSYTLLHLSVGPDHFNHDLNHTLYSLHHLRSLQCKAVLRYKGASVDLSPKPFEFFIFILTNLLSPSTITNLDIVVQYTWVTDNVTQYQDMDMSPWILLAEFLTEQMEGGKFNKLKEISVGIVMERKYKQVLTLRDIWMKIRETFGGLNQNGVKVEYYEASTEGW